MSFVSPAFEHIVLRRVHDVLFVTLHRPDTRNALAPEVVAELAQVLSLAEAGPGIRALVLRGSRGFFCAGGNVGNFQARLDAQPSQAGGALSDDPVAARNREFGNFMQRLAALPVPVVAAVEGAAMGGGMGLACAADIVLATRDARFALSETSLGIIPAQIAPFVVDRLGLRVTRRMGLCGERVNGDAAVALGLVDELAEDGAGLDALLAQWLTRICNCGPQANRTLKSLLQGMRQGDTGQWLDEAALQFAACMRGEGKEGIAAFRERRPAEWRREFSADDVRAAHTTGDAPASAA